MSVNVEEFINHKSTTLIAFAGSPKKSIPASDAGFARNPDYKGKGLQLQFTVEDEGVFTMPWSATITYRRPLSTFGGWPEIVCGENLFGYFPGKKAAIPTADRPDF